MNEPLNKLQVMCKERTQRDIAASFDISESYLSDILHGRREIPDRILSVLGYEWRLVSIDALPHPVDAAPVPVLNRALSKAFRSDSPLDPRD